MTSNDTSSLEDRLDRCVNDFAGRLGRSLEDFAGSFHRCMEDLSAHLADRPTDRQHRLLASSSPSPNTPDFAGPHPRPIFGRMADNSDPFRTLHPAPIATYRAADREEGAERGISHFEAPDDSDADDSDTPGSDIDDSDTPYNSDSESDSHAAGSRPSYNYKTDNHIYTPAYRDFLSHMRRGSPSEYTRMTEQFRCPTSNPVQARNSTTTTTRPPIRPTFIAPDIDPVRARHSSTIRYKLFALRSTGPLTPREQRVTDALYLTIDRIIQRHGVLPAQALEEWDVLAGLVARRQAYARGREASQGEELDELEYRVGFLEEDIFGKDE
ncbi:hypothetical protein GE09DRAFT_99115 [Coniochaeta sp. 2T2.1]|nr:hypothetical protein GE09DRAFT_99115 [Coniochaeta sp. 2T2.1]